MYVLVLVYANPSEHSMHGTLGMLIEPTKEWLSTQLERIALYKKMKEEDQQLAYIDYWCNDYPVLDLYGEEKEWLEEVSDNLESKQWIEIPKWQADEIYASENSIRTDVNRIIVASDQIHIAFLGKHSDLRYQTESFSEHSMQAWFNQMLTQEHILRGYLEAVLWAETDGDDPLDSKYEIEHITKDSIKQAKYDIYAFMKKALDLFTYEELKDPDQIGHDLHLTRHGHGSGFWDGDYKNGEDLTKICEKMGSVNVLLREERFTSSPVSRDSKEVIVWKDTYILTASLLTGLVTPRRK